jgi:formylglycine-generating enzyme required for sulfatase activity
LRPARPVTSKQGARFTPAYRQLYRYVRSHTIESDLHMLNPYEFHADSTRLMQMLEKGHHGVVLSTEAWDRLITWIDLNTPAHGRWTDIVGSAKVRHQQRRRQLMLKRYAGLEENPEVKLTTAVLQDSEPRLFRKTPSSARERALFSSGKDGEAGDVGSIVDAGRQSHGALQPGEARATFETSSKESSTNDLGKRRSIKIGPRVTLNLVRVGQTIWMGETEITNAQFAQFDPTHDSRLEHGDWLHFTIQERGYTVNDPRQPVVRVSWDQAMAFCEWLSQETGLHISLPTQDEWEIVCRAGTRTPMWYGDTTTDFSSYANLADRTFRKVDAFSPRGLPAKAIEEMRPAVNTVNDGYRVSAPVGTFKPNPWGLHDMHGNVAEWTRSASPRNRQRRIVRGGSWYDRPQHAHSAFTLSYLKWAGVYDVGFRVVCYGLE